MKKHWWDGTTTDEQAPATFCGRPVAFASPEWTTIRRKATCEDCLQLLRTISGYLPVAAEDGQRNGSL